MKCRALAAEIDRRALETDAYDAEKQWTAPSGQPVYPAPIKPEDITAEFLADIPKRASFFTGWPPEGVILTGLGTALWRAVRPLSPALGVRLLARWWHRLQREPSHYTGPTRDAARLLARRLERHLPVALRPPANFDGTDMDRLALCERLTATHNLGVFRCLAASASPVILEIGAGYGMLAAALLEAFPSAVYLVVDIPSSLTLAGCYLATRRRCRVAVCRAPAGLSSGEVGLTLNTDLSAIEGRPITLAINTLSFGEMNPAIVGQYAAFLRRNLAPTGFLFEQNFDNTHVGSENFCDPAAVLSRHLRLRAHERRRRYLKGVPRLWAMS
ncbi:MAG TPA: putative sugar O-methyltransferase [Stellaceae bacterium]|nr:putative sugar O-methyltransferase [Stellaceae bacterium]